MNDLKIIHNKIKSRAGISGSEAVIVIKGSTNENDFDFLPSDNQISIQDAYKAYMSGTILLLDINTSDGGDLYSQVIGAFSSNGEIQLIGLVGLQQITWGSDDSDSDEPGSDTLVK